MRKVCVVCLKISDHLTSTSDRRYCRTPSHPSPGQQSVRLHDTWGQKDRSSLRFQNWNLNTVWLRCACKCTEWDSLASHIWFNLCSDSPALHHLSQKLVLLWNESERVRGDRKFPFHSYARVQSADSCKGLPKLASSCQDDFNMSENRYVQSEVKWWTSWPTSPSLRLCC